MNNIDIRVFVEDHTRFAIKAIQHPIRAFQISREIDRARANLRRGGAPIEWHRAKQRLDKATQRRVSFALWG